MCQATVYLLHNGQKEEIMREANFLEVTGDGVRVATFFTEPRFVPAKVASIDFLKHVVMLVPSTEGNR
jgi:predicted RNA-binding protein